MKRPILLLTFIASFAACTQNIPIKSSGDGASESENTSVATTDTLCFARYSGLQKQDTASVRFILDGNKVSGQLANYPYEKDSRVGIIAGIKSGDIIKGTWHYQQEGRMDSIGFEFKLEGNSLLQKQTSYDMNTGREMLTDTAGFSLEFIKLDCEKINLPATGIN